MQKIKVVFAGGGTGGHIYPGLAVASSLAEICRKENIECEIHWIGNKEGMDSKIITENLVKNGGVVTNFCGISCGKLRRYFSWQNFLDIFKILGGFFESFSYLKKLKPDFLFSKGGFVSVPPCKAAALLKIPYYTHECDYTPGLATKLNSKSATKICVSYNETISRFSPEIQNKCVVTGNPVRPVFYKENIQIGLNFLGVPLIHAKPLLLIQGGSLGAKQINTLVVENLSWLKEKFIVVHQMGEAFAKEHPELFESADENYKPFDFIHSQMPDVLHACDVVISRSGANSIWECAVCAKPMILIPLVGNGTRGDQLDNAKYFEERGAAIVLAGEEANAENLKNALTLFLQASNRKTYSEHCKELSQGKMPAATIAQMILEGCKK